MRLLGSLLLLSVTLAAQTQAPVGIIRGQLLEWDSKASTGQLCIRTPSHKVFRFVFDSKTYVERESRPIDVRQLQKGDDLEILADELPGSLLRYARTVQVVETDPQQTMPLSRGRYRAYRKPAPTTDDWHLDSIIPRGNLTFAGVISRMNDEHIVLRTRSDGEKTIYLRPDTRYLENGEQVQLSTLKPNTSVFVRGGKNLENEIEAYKVVWGRILLPDVSQ